MKLDYQRRMASSILKCGRERVWLDPNRLEDISEAVTRGDIRRLIVSGAIKKKQVRGISRARKQKRALQKKKGRRRGHGKRKGAAKARHPKKRAWIQTIRPIRRLLREMRDSGKISRRDYRLLYRQAKGGMFRSKAHLLAQMKARGIEIKKKKKMKKLRGSEDDPRSG